MPWQPGQKLKITTKRLVMKTMTPGDVNQDYLSWWNDDQLQEGLGHKSRNWTFERAVQHVKSFDNIKGFHLGVYLKETGKMIGFYSMNRDPVQKVSSSTTLIGDKNYWRQGLAKEISETTIGFRFRGMGIEKIEGKVRGDNVASKALLESLGFKKEGVLVKHGPAPGGGRIDITLYGLLKEEWLTRQNKDEAVSQ